MRKASVRLPRQGHGLCQPTSHRPRRYKTKLVDSTATNAARKPIFFEKKQTYATAISTIPPIQNIQRKGIMKIGSGNAKICDLPKLLINLASAVVNNKKHAEYKKKLMTLLRLFCNRNDTG